MERQVEVQHFNAVTYRRYPDARGLSDRRYYVAGIADRQAGRATRLHEDIYVAHHGPVPDGFHVHHADGDHDNNDPANLVAISGDEHRAHHREGWSELASRPAQLEHLERIRPAAAVWHSTPEGLAWHRAHGVASWVNREEVERRCDSCGTTYSTRSRHGEERFCSGACKSRARRESGVDDVDRLCAWEPCRTPFRTNRYKPREHCGGSCAAKTRNAARRTAAVSGAD